MKNTGLIIIIAGIILTIVTTFKFFKEEKVIDIGTVEISRNKPIELSWSPLIGLAVIGIGSVVLWQASKK